MSNSLAALVMVETPLTNAFGLIIERYQRRVGRDR